MLVPKRKVKLKSKIVVPDNFCVITLSKEKLIDKIPSGEHELNGFTIEKTCKINKLDKPTKKGYKKEMKVDFYFVNLNECLIKNQFSIKKLKKEIYYSLNFKIKDPDKFLKFLICERIVFDQKFAVKHLTFSLSKVLYYYMLDNKIVDKEKLINYAIKKLNTIGVEVLNMEVVFNDFDNFNNKKQNQKCTQNEFENEKIEENNCLEEITIKNNSYMQNYDKINENNINFDENLHSKEQNKKNLDDFQNNFANENHNEKENNTSKNYRCSSLIDLEDVKAESVSYFICDECGAKLYSNAKVCYRCKKSFIEKNCCENCGQEIKKGVYVCPYCKSVLFNNN